MTVTNVLRYDKSSMNAGENKNDNDDDDNNQRVQEAGPYSIYRNWRVPDKANLPVIDNTTSPNKINCNWLKELLVQHCNDTQNVPSDLVDKALVVAPMVEQSDLPFRLQCRKYGANLCFTPMIHSRLFQENERYRAKFLCDNTPPEDRPLIAQLCGPDPYILLKTAKEIAPFVDGIDLNCGCPQGIARRGLYGAFLLEEEDLLLSIVQTLVHHLPDTPVSVKVRLLPDVPIEKSIELYTKLVDCGASMLTIHGRTRHQTNYRTGPADWNAIRQVVDALGHRIPILANGMIASLKDVRECLSATNAAGVVSSEAILEYPPLFCDEVFSEGKRSGPSRLELVREYLDLAKKYPPQIGGQGSGLKSIRMHVHKILHSELQCNPKFRMQCVNADSWEELEECLESLRQILDSRSNYDSTEEGLSWYLRHRQERPKVIYDDTNDQQQLPVKYKPPDDDVPLPPFFGNDDDSEDEY